LTLVIKRAFDLLISGVGLIALSPVLVLVAIWIRFDSPGPALFRQERVGRNGVAFRIHKFRTMYWNGPQRGLSLTVGDDSRITRCGRILRRTKLDELPQLLDVLVGAMSLVGPRPEVPSYVAHWSEDDRRVILSVRPGITDLASIRFRRESEVLGQSSDPVKAYLNEIMPEKLRLYREYVENRSLAFDLQVLFHTALAVLFHTNHGGARTQSGRLGAQPEIDAPADRTDETDASVGTKPSSRD